MAKQRLDKLLVSLELCDSRALAQRLIRAGKVKVNQEIIDKPGTEVKISAEIQVKEKPPYVSRGGKSSIKRCKNLKSRSKIESVLMGEFLRGVSPIVFCSLGQSKCME